MTSTMTKAKTSKQISCKVRMLDDQELPFHIDPKATGQDLFTTVCNYIDLLENDYFALEYLDSHRNACWLEMDKPVLKQVSETKFSFCVKFYTPDPGQLEEEFTRYQFALQIKRDLQSGTLLCSDNTAALLASYIVQAEIGDYLESYNNNPSYLSGRKFFPHQTNEHEIRIMNFHKNHVGQLPADADLNLLDIARKVELYGIKMHPAKDHEQVNLNLSVAHMGILVFQNITKINTFSWAKIRKLSFKRKKFLIKLQPEGYGYYKDTVEFYFDTRDECKNFWKKCIEYHAFFRCVTIKRAHRSRSKILTRGSSFRYNGRTQKEMIEYAREHYSKNRTFTRSYSSTRTVAPTTGRSHRSPGSALKSSDTMRSQDTNLSSMESNRYASRPIPLSTSTSSPTTTAAAALPTITTTMTNNSATASSNKVVEPTDTILSTTPNDVYQQVYHDDSSTHGSRTLDSRYSRDKFGSSDNESSDEEEQEQEKAKVLAQVQEQPNPINGTETATTTAITVAQPNIDNDSQQQRAERKNSKEIHEALPATVTDDRDRGKSPGVEKEEEGEKSSVVQTVNHHDNEEKEEDVCESNHEKTNEVSLEIYHHNQTDQQGQRYSASVKMYLNARNSAGISQTTRKDSQTLQVDRSVSMDFTRSPSCSSSSSSSSAANVDIIVPIEKDENEIHSKESATSVVIEIRDKPTSLPRMTDYIEYVDRRRLPSRDSLSWQDDTIEKDQVLSLNAEDEGKSSSSEDAIELVRDVIESMVKRIVEEERQLIVTVERLVEQACSRALNLYRIERRVQLFSRSASHLPHHKSCMLRSNPTDNTDQNETTLNSDNGSRLRTKSSPVIHSTTDWTDISRRLAAQTCFAAFPSGSDIHTLDRSEFSTFSEAKLKFFNIVSTTNEIIPSQSSISLPLPQTIPHGGSSSSSTRSSRASSVSSYASSMHVPCPPVVDNHSKRSTRPLSARLLDLSDDSDSNLSTSISTSLRTCILPSTISSPRSPTSARVGSTPVPPLLRPQRRQQQQSQPAQQKQRHRSNEEMNSSSDDSLSNHLNKAAGYRSVFVTRHHHMK